MSHAEALLFVDNQQTEIAEFHVFGEEAVRADRDVDFPRSQLLDRLLQLFFGSEA